VIRAATAARWPVCPPLAIARSFSSWNANLSIALRAGTSCPHVLDLYPAHHLADDHFDVLVGDVDALQAVDFLDSFTR